MIKMKTQHRLEGGTWKTGEKPLINVPELIYSALGRRFPITMNNGKFHSMEGDFSAEEKATIKQILEDNGAV